MRRAVWAVPACVIVVILCLLPRPALAQEPRVTRLSVAQDGAEAKGGSSGAFLSGDARYAGFSSYANNLVPGDTTTGRETFIRDREDGALTQVPNISASRLSADGRFLAFSTSQENLVPGDSNGVEDVFVMDWQSGQISRVSVSSGGAQGNARSFSPTISADGSYVAFVSEATNLVDLSLYAAGDEDPAAAALPIWRVYLRDIAAGLTTLVSVSSAGKSANRDSWYPSISADGSYIAFTSEADNLTFLFPGMLYSDQPNIYRHDWIEFKTILISQNPDGEMANGPSMGNIISADGQIVAFNSGASDLVANDGNKASDVFVRNVPAETNSVVSLSSGGTQATASSVLLSMSSDGRKVLFYSAAGGITPGDTNGVEDIFLRDTQAGVTTRVSLGSDSSEPNKRCDAGVLSADGRFAAFTSYADNLVYCDRNQSEDVFLVDLQGAFEPWPTVGSVSLAVPADPLRADGATQAPVEVIVTDTEGRPMPCVTVTFSVNPQLGHVWPTSATTGHDGTAVVTYTVPYEYELAGRTSVDVIAASGGKSDSGTIHFGTPPPCIEVRNAAGAGVQDAEVYINGQWAGDTPANGRLCVPFAAGDELIARHLEEERVAAKGNHEGSWSQRFYLTSMDPDPGNGEPAPFVVTDAMRDQVLTLRRGNVLLGFNILVSVEWDASEAVLADLKRGFELASVYLHDATNGQMLFEQVEIVDNSRFFADADYQVKALNNFRPEAYVGALHMGKQRHIYFGRFWGGSTGKLGDWRQPAAYRTFIHEFGHYGLRLFDSYFFLNGGQKVRSDCTGLAIRTNAEADRNATLMDFQYNASEFAMQGVAGQWSPQCTQTRQWQIRGESDWESIARFYNGAGWTLTTPAAHGSVVAGPDIIPIADWSQVRVAANANTGVCKEAPSIIVRLAGGISAEVEVTLARQSGHIIRQGVTDETGRLVVLGAGEGDRVHLYYKTAQMAAPVTGEAVITCVQNQVVPPPPPVTPPPEPPLFALDVEVTPGPGANEASIVVKASTALSAPPLVSLRQSGADGRVDVAMSYQDASLDYRGVAKLQAGLAQEGDLWVIATSTQGRTLYYIFPFKIVTVTAMQSEQVWSDDGKAELYVPDNAFTADTRLVLYPDDTLPQPSGETAAEDEAAGATGAAKKLVVVSGPYAIRAEAGASLAQKAALSLFYTPAGGAIYRSNLSTAKVYRWDGSAWAALASTVDEQIGYVTATIDSFGVYAAMAEEGPRVSLPAVFR